MPFLTITTADGDQETHELEGETITIGRSDESTLHLDDGSLSGSHAELRQSGDGYTLVDLDSTNGTLVNNDQISENDLSDGDQITFGSMQAVYTIAHPDEATGAEAEAEADEEAAGVEDEEEGAEAEDDDAGLPEASAAAAGAGLSQEIGAHSARPADFASISPFPKKKKAKDPVGSLFMMIACLSIVASIALVVCSMIMKAA